MKRRNALLLGWVSVEPKQIYQLRALSQLGFRLRIVTNDLLGRSRYVVSEISGDTEIHITHGSKLKKLMITARVIVTSSSRDVALIPCASRMSAIIVILCRVRGLRTIVIEWGDIGIFETLSRATQWNMKLSYQLSHRVWFKEPFMYGLLQAFGARRPYFLPNAVEELSHASDRAFLDRDIDFLWINRLSPGRRLDWFLHGLGSYAGLDEPKTIVMGLLSPDQCDESTWKAQINLTSNLPDSVQVLAYANPIPYYERARFFVLASDHVFGNNALLEAMCSGVVPLVSQSPDVENVVTHGWNGLVFPHNEVGLRDAIEHAINMSPETWEEMSLRAKESTRRNFNTSNWASGAADLMLGEI